MNHFDRSAGYQLLETASLVDFRIGEPIIQTCTDGENIFLQVDLMLGSDDEEEAADIAEWASFGLIRCETIEVDTLFKVKVISLIFDYLADTGIA